MITKDLAMRIYRCYTEIESAEKLHAECLELVQSAKPEHWRDAFGRERGLEMGVPNGKDTQRIFQVSPSAALLVLVDYISTKGKELKELQKEAQRLLQFYHD